ncbi:MAG TPA: prolipoprotein diacylglyceryl transferase [Candidatus Polarisedimenticolaceae bacterium]|nr:prolipoprotein diacylglyceryl transferase [Candidatus Polarisedimenticolaceae bacterium]
MHPSLVDFGTFDLPLLGPTHLFLPTYGLLFAIGAVVAWWWFVRRARVLGLPQEPVFNLAFYTLLAGLIGAKLTLIAIDLPYYLANPVEILATIRSAGVLMGGILAGAIVFIGYALRHRLPVLALGDAIVAPVALAQGIGRLGCLAAGCCWGVSGGGWCSIRFASPAAHEQTGVPLGVPLVPTQIIEMVFDLLLAGVLTWAWRRRLRPDGTVAWLYLILYGTGRGIIEHWRGDAVRGIWFHGALSTSQLFSIVAIVTGAVLLARGRRRATTSPA